MTCKVHGFWPAPRPCDGVCAVVPFRAFRFTLALLVVAPINVEAASTPKKPAMADKRRPPAASVGAGRSPTAHLGPPSGPQRSNLAMSIGSPTDGRILGGSHLPLSPYLRVYPAYGNSDVRWGIDSLVGLIDRAAKSVRKQYPDAVLSVGHLSKQGGGELDRHASHESGRDADVGFYVRDAAGKPILSDHMVPFVGDGTSKSWPGAHFDDARNWALVAAMVGDGQSRVTHIFVATPLRERLLAYAAKIGASPVLRSRASAVLAQPRGSLPHDDHFHVRVACPSGMAQCIELPVARRPGNVNGRPAIGHHAPGQQTAPSSSPGAGVARRGGPPLPPKAAKKPEQRGEDKRDEEETVMPSLSPSVPGLDSVIIPAPLGHGLSTWGSAKDPTEPPISDPDGVLESR